MNGYGFTFCAARLVALPSGALYWPEFGCLVVSDLHLGRSERYARRGGVLLPPYETAETLARLRRDVQQTDPGVMVCLGDSFDDTEAVPDASGLRAIIGDLATNRRWIWIKGNHDPRPPISIGESAREWHLGPLVFRHEARKGDDASGEVSGHFHPKMRLAGQWRSCFLVDERRIIMPAYGRYTGGMACDRPPLRDLVQPDAIAVLTGPRAYPVPLLRAVPARRPS
ncbi:putative phosphoesterase [Albidovulum inexpectatum]|uniref:Putative phosphoesterase n=1 Tax=Albidovulum inexpectatum TaxID=196587 RepID=A0A2S5JGK7_9RHOB|nr:ligase-associated DNA damage response endonuclease PdeM [Albidovulum inexpectatum]PPB80488.1 putative phosphoesterase [Albidovulum inexpectatum]